MSLSDWDVLAVDEMGRPSNGVSEPSPGGVWLDLVEDRLRLCCPDAWSGAAGLPRPAVGWLREGEAAFRDVAVLAQRGPRRGLAWATWAFRGAELSGTVGVCCEGFIGGHYAGIDAEMLAFLAGRLTDWGGDGRLPRQLATLGLGNVLRFNQGDAYFAQKMGHALAATPPGQAELPLLYHTRQGEALGRIQVHAPGSPEALAEAARAHGADAMRAGQGGPPPG